MNTTIARNAFKNFRKVCGGPCKMGAAFPEQGKNVILAEYDGGDGVE